MIFTGQTIAYTKLQTCLGLRSLDDKGQSHSVNKHILELDWAALNFNPVEVCRKFFELPIVGRLTSISEELDLSQWKGLTTKWRIWADSPDCQLRIDKKLAQILLTQALGPKENDDNFSCHTLTETEREILETQIEEIVNYLTSALEEFEDYNPKFAGHFYHLVWLAEINGEIGKIAMTIPAEFLPINQDFANRTAIRDEEDCKTATIKVNLQVGRTRLTLADLANFEPEDFLLLEESNKNYLSIIGFDEMAYAVPLFINSKKVDSKWHKIKLSDNNVHEIKKAMSQVLNKDVLGDFPVDIKAEFKDVKMTLKDLFALQSGWVLPIDQVTENELLLTSQGKTIAKGELVVAGNKLGILIKEVFLNDKQ